MTNSLPNCWELENCGRGKGGSFVAELGECVVSMEQMGHSCWAVAGTFCKGKVQGIFAEKIGQCSRCQVYKLYNRAMGTHGKEISEKLPEENEKYKQIMKQNI